MLLVTDKQMDTYYQTDKKTTLRGRRERKAVAE